MFPELSTIMRDNAAFKDEWYTTGKTPSEYRKAAQAEHLREGGP